MSKAYDILISLEIMYDKKEKIIKNHILSTDLHIFTNPTSKFKVVLGKQKHLTDGLTRC